MVTVSIVIPTYQRPKLLANCLKALLQQKFDKHQYEIIVVSDGPDEQTKAAISKWSLYDHPQIKYLPLPQKKGPAGARNYGWLNAKGSIIAFTDDDCLPDAHWLQQIVAHCDPEKEIAITGKVIVPISGRPTDHEQNTAHLQTADFITANCACTKKALIKAGGFDEEFEMAWREDSDLHFKFIHNNVPITKVKSALVVHPVRPSAWGESIKDQKKTMYNALLYKKHPDLYDRLICQKTPLLYYCIIAAFIMMVAGWISHHPVLTTEGFAGWAALTIWFTYKRLKNTSLSPSHVLEMIYTSIIIPFASVFWQWYGAIKYRVLFI
ncbi:glycosyltransferase [Mucilaginibacter sp. 44-25]|uniref:glycosyltransferase family 2 protein n=1 Tax=Mucilaginibacter sp. 44-25 TaxID=1895794 RepID=UPI00095C36E8|nr:glycosyltransferase [Mucilaginibacter sp. 44-25]OJW16931.1 MAG: family 2 glycosyl transferase [Mucilaginibacter sp. 44-25]